MVFIIQLWVFGFRKYLYDGRLKTAVRSGAKDIQEGAKEGRAVKYARFVILYVRMSWVP